jgi:hypothetical protein
VPFLGRAHGARRKRGDSGRRAPLLSAFLPSFLATALGAAALRGPGDLTAAAAEGAEPLGAYLAELEKSGRLPPETASLERLRERLSEAEEALVRGDARTAAAGLFALVEAPRYALWRDSVPFQNAEFLLGRALLRGGAHASAERYLVRLLGRGPRGPYWVAAHRALVDLALETRDYDRLLGVMGALAPGMDVPADSSHEREYLRGRVYYGHGDLAAAAAAFARVPRSSRLYASAAYFRGLVAARRRAFADARGAFCEILPGKDGASLAFNVDGRYYAVSDLARLGLGRVAHEQDRYDEAYYFYFSVPEDSERLAEALFEAAFSMYQKGEAAAARAFVEAFDRRFPDAPQRAEMKLLRANLALRACEFDRARSEAGTLVTGYAAVQRLAAAATGDPVRARRLTQRLLARRGAAVATADEEGQLLSLLKLDDRFATLERSLRAVEDDLEEAHETARGWRSLAAIANGKSATYGAAASPEAAALLSETEALVPLLADAPELAPRVQALLGEVALVAYPPSGPGPYAAEEAAARDLIVRLETLRRELLAAADAAVVDSLRELDERLRSLFRQTRLVHIDAVVGRKKRLEIEIANLRAGRLTPALYAKLKSEGALGDDEEYWPFEGEYWSDEYENFR